MHDHVLRPLARAGPQRSYVPWGTRMIIANIDDFLIQGDPMRIATLADVDLIKNILLVSFRNDPHVTWLLKESKNKFPDGHFKFLHLWPPQNPPLDSIVIA
jgi:hypothetical protein